MKTSLNEKGKNKSTCLQSAFVFSAFSVYDSAFREIVG